MNKINILKSIKYSVYVLLGMMTPFLTTGIIIWGIKLSPEELILMIALNILYLVGICEIATQLKNAICTESWESVFRALVRKIRKHNIP